MCTNHSFEAANLTDFEQVQGSLIVLLVKQMLQLQNNLLVLVSLFVCDLFWCCLQQKKLQLLNQLENIYMGKVSVLTLSLTYCVLCHKKWGKPTSFASKQILVRKITFFLYRQIRNLTQNQTNPMKPVLHMQLPPSSFQKAWFNLLKNNIKSE